MELKKNEKYDLEKKSPLFFSIGLVIALAFVTAAFEWRGELDGINISEQNDEFPPMYIVPSTVIPPPEKPEPIRKKETKPSEQPPKFVDDPDLTKAIETVNDPIDDPELNPPIMELPPEKPEEPPVMDIVESMPSFPGGMSAFYSYVGKNIEYPRKAKTMQVTGRVFIEFVIDTDGTLIDVKAVKGIGSGCDEEAVKVLKNSPKWNPGKQRGRAVRVRMILPITFSLR